MHICFVCNEYPPVPHGGIGSFTQTMARALVGCGHRVTVVGCYRQPRATVGGDEGVQVVRLQHTTVRGAGAVVHQWRLAKALRRLHADCPIDVLEGPEDGLVSVPRGFPAIKVIRMNGGHRFFSVTLGSKPRAWRSWVESRSFAKADRVCAVSQYVASVTAGLLGTDRAGIEILPNPVDSHAFRPTDRAREEAGLITFVGSLCEKKGIRQLILAMPSILQAVPHARLRIIGRDTLTGPNGTSYRAQLEAAIPAGTRPYVEFTGVRAHSDLPAALSTTAVCAYPSHMEALPIAWLEGMSMGKAVVASRCGPGPEVIEDGRSGMLCDPHSSASIAAAIIQVLKQPSLGLALGRAARARVEQLFSLEVLVKRNEAFYQRCLTRA
jgi:glycosyltransferase involved in cell wall biosynthesis